MRFSILLTTCIFLSSLTTSYAQYWELGAAGGVTLYHGDLAPDFTMQAPGMAINAFARRNLDSRLSVRMGVAFGTIAASDANSANEWQQARNLSFQSEIFEGSVALEFNFLPYHHDSRKRGPGTFTPYMVLGVGVFRFNPRARYENGLYPLQPLGTEGQEPGSEYNLVQGNILIGGGFKIDIGDYVSLNIEGSTRILFTDYLDDVGGTYANKRLIEGNRGSLGTIAAALSDRSGEIGQNIGMEGRQRGDFNTNDGYTMFSVGVHYTIYTLKCPAY